MEATTNGNIYGTLKIPWIDECVSEIYGDDFLLHWKPSHLYGTIINFMFMALLHANQLYCETIPSSERE